MLQVDFAYGASSSRLAEFKVQSIRGSGLSQKMDSLIQYSNKGDKPSLLGMVVIASDH